MLPASDVPVSRRCLRVPIRCIALAGALTGAMALSVMAQGVTGTGAALPAEIEAALTRARLPRESLSVMVVDAQAARATPRLSHRAQVPVNPASVMKLVTTYAALEQLGPAYVWNTPVYLQGCGPRSSSRLPHWLRWCATSTNTATT